MSMSVQRTGPPTPYPETITHNRLDGAGGSDLPGKDPPQNTSDSSGYPTLAASPVSPAQEAQEIPGIAVPRFGR
jgi:hypothetical protein